jgi:hypothetical protein
MSFAILALALSASSAMPAPPHSATVAHAYGPARADYDTRIVVTHRQVGAVAGGGRAGTLACRWSADVAVERTAITAGNSLARRSFTQKSVASGQRPGWCSSARTAIDRDVSARLGDLSARAALAARDDHPALMSDLDRIALR